MPCALTSIAHSRIPGRAGRAHTGMSGPRNCERGPGHAAGARRGRERRPANATRDQGTGEAASETFACMVAFVSPTGPPGETFACMHALVSLEVGTHLRETFACMHAFVSLAGRLGETFACMHTFVSLGANGSRNRGADGQRCQQRRVAGPGRTGRGTGARLAGGRPCAMPRRGGSSLRATYRNLRTNDGGRNRRGDGGRSRATAQCGPEGRRGNGGRDGIGNGSTVRRGVDVRKPSPEADGTLPTSPLDSKKPCARQGFICDGGKYGARTRDLRRDRPAL